MVRTRAERRHHHQRMLERTRKFECVNGMEKWFTKEQFEKRIRQIAENRKACSCWMCGNARKIWKKKTFQETKQEIAMRDWEELIK